MKLGITHSTTYRFEHPVPYALFQLRLAPKDRPSQKIISWSNEIQSGKKELEFDDHHHNHVELVSLEAESASFEVICEGQVETKDTSGVLGKHGGYLPLWQFLQETPLTQPGPLIRKLVKDFRKSKSDALETLHGLSSTILNEVTYKTDTTTVESTAEEVLGQGSGVCQDHTHVFLSAARQLGFPARYVSGYLMLNERIQQDAAHAWAEIHVDALGWVGFDVSNGISPDERYVPVATGLDYLQAAPVSGLRFGAGSESMVVNLQVQQ